VALTAPIKELGLHVVSVSLHPEVGIEILLNVARSQEEADLQAAGKSIQEMAAEEEAAAEFEIAELFDDIGAAQADDDELLAEAGDEAPQTEGADEAEVDDAENASDA
jgi:large subunit ribosomal protein L9